MFEGIGFWPLMGLNMALTAVAATLGDAGTQKFEMCLRRPPAKRRKRRPKEPAEAPPPDETPRSKEDEDTDDDDAELEDWLDSEGNELELQLRFYRGSTIITSRDIGLKAKDPEASPRNRESVIAKGQKGTCVKVPGDTPGSVAQVAFLMDGETVSFDAMPGDVELYLQEYDPWRTVRLVVVVALIFEPISFTWYTVVLPEIVPGHAGQLTAHQMTRKIVWDVLLYGSTVVFVNITNNAILQANSAEIRAENERQGVTACQHIGRRLSHDMPPMWCIMVVGSVMEDVVGFQLISAKWQSLAFKCCDLTVLFIMSYIINLRISVKDKTPVVNHTAQPPAALAASTGE